ncbi:MAG: hypothetical protein ACLTT1_09775, partial [[Clostridium] scindens]
SFAAIDTAMLLPFLSVNQHDCSFGAHGGFYISTLSRLQPSTAHMYKSYPILVHFPQTRSWE